MNDKTMTDKIINDFKEQLPAECRAITIEPRHRTALQHVRVGGSVWVVLLTAMPGQRCQAWRLGVGEYWGLQPRYGSRDRFVRENMQPTLEGDANPQRHAELSLF